MNVGEFNIKLTGSEFESFQALTYSFLGIKLTDNKRSLVENRFQNIIKTNGYKTYQDYINHLKQNCTKEAISQFIDRISTNHSYFYRENEGFEYFSNHALPEIVRKLKQANSHDLRIWSAGCATGEEPYMLAILIMEYLGSELPLWKAGVLATDISDKALTEAKSGIYTEEKMRFLPEGIKKKYFRQSQNGDFAINNIVKAQVTFRKYNLMNERSPFKNQFHIIFCRNVMIYMDQEVNQNLVNKFYNITVSGGYFFIGLSETIRRNNNAYKYIQPSTYKKYAS